MTIDRIPSTTEHSNRRAPAPAAARVTVLPADRLRLRVVAVAAIALAASTFALTADTAPAGAHSRSSTVSSCRRPATSDHVVRLSVRRTTCNVGRAISADWERSTLAAGAVNSRTVQGWSCIPTAKGEEEWSVRCTNGSRALRFWWGV